ncbi:OPT/YSL family transporter [Fictibacillus sp. Mic-4]|uniref:OPT/YSL family transporter n=1 Tax=Fictibacillus sp. Mic-4 TaxID=3132826 RepID=UPI003CF72226
MPTNQQEQEVNYARSLSEQLTFRGIFIGTIGSCIITTSSMYIALRMGSLPWPTIFAAVLSMVILKALGSTNVNEINLTHTTMSAGAMVAGGLAFTIPGVWMIDKDADISLLTLFIVTICGTVLGLLFTGLIRSFFIVQKELPFPMGIAASQTVMAGIKGKKAKLLFSSLGLSAAITAFRDGFNWFSSTWMSAKLAIHNLFFGIWLSPMAVGMGYLIGPLYTSIWFLGAGFTYFVLIPVGLAKGWFDSIESAAIFKDSLGIGLMVGSGIGILLKGILPKTKEIYGLIFNEKVDLKRILSKAIPIALILIAFFLTFLTELSLFPSILMIIGVWLTTIMAGTITGQTGINPMEVFAILVLVAIKSLFNTTMIESFLIAAIVAVACGLTGGVLNDFKSGHLLRTDPKAQFISEAIGGVIGAIVSCLVLYVMFQSYGAMGPGTELPAPQAFAVSTMIDGLPDVKTFFAGLIIGALLYVFNIPGMTIGLGLYLPIYMSTTVFIGGMLKFIISKLSAKKAKNGMIISSGLLGGEGVAGVVIAIVKVLTGG